MNSTIPYYPVNQPIPRDQYLAIVRSGIAFREFRFARQAISHWLSTFPGDLPFRYQYAYTLFKEGHSTLAIPILDEIIQIDPEYLDVVEMKLKILQVEGAEIQGGKTYHENGNLSASYLEYLEWSIGLKGRESNYTKYLNVAPILTGWGEKIFSLRKMIQQASHDSELINWLEENEESFLKILADKPDNPLVAIVHLELSRIKTLAGKSPIGALNSLSKYYHERFPTCLQCSLIQVERLLDSGQADNAVALLHLCASKDVTGQVARRLWGGEHPYKNLWPDPLERKLNLAIPISVASFFGWNQLPISATEEITPNNVHPTNLETNNLNPEISGEGNLLNGRLEQSLNNTQSSGENHILTGSTSSIVEEKLVPPEQGDDDLFEKDSVVQNIDLQVVQNPSSHNEKNAKQMDFEYPEIIREVQAELERLGNRLHRPDLINSDGRYPVYVIMTTQAGLETTFGGEKCSLIKNEILRLREAIQTSLRWRTLLFIADQGETLPDHQSVSEPIKYTDPWALKLALVDLDAHLAHKGEMIGALLIVGGEEIVPFHSLPNPVDDSDENVASDNPYSTRDENYFIPEWPVGRLPTSLDDDGNFLLKLIHNLFAIYSTRADRSPLRRSYWWNGVLNWITSFLPQFSTNNGSHKSFGYTAAAWRSPSFAVFKSIGEPRTMLISPQAAASKIKPPKTFQRQYWQRGSKKTIFAQKSEIKPVLTPGVYIPTATLGYFNLHGLEDAGEWYGQSDPSEIGIDGGERIEYPVALRPDDIGANQQNAPLVVFSEACYSAHIHSKKQDQAIAFRFLQKGTLTYIGSTCISYGAIILPLTAADYLGRFFWIGIQQGLPTGESLRRAKIALVQEMHRRKNGYLDGETQKTLISFVLYGDPLTQPFNSNLQPKVIQRNQKRPQTPLAICDHLMTCIESQSINPETTQKVKEIVERYLPGMKDARMSLRNEQSGCLQKCETCHLKGNLGAKTRAENEQTDDELQASQQNRQVVILKKHMVSNLKEHSQFARLTLDKDGKLLKLVVSR